MIPTISEKLQSSRKELLDISLRNNMLNFVLKGAKTLSVVNKPSEEIFNILHRERRSMTFAALSKQKLARLPQQALVEAVDDVVESHGAEAVLRERLETLDWSAFEDEFGVPEGDKARRQLDTRLQTTLAEEPLFLQLLKIHTEARTCIEEQGVNTLFLALGFLHWYESDASDTVRKAPLLLLPVNLERSSSKEAFNLKYSEDDLVENLSLVAKLKTDFGLDLATAGFDEELFSNTLGSLEGFFRLVDERVSQQKRWKVADNEIALGFFSFGKFLMFKDLDPGSWPEDKQPASHTLLSRLLGSGFGEQPPAFAEDLHIDTVIEPGQVNFVMDADSSQTQALLEVRAGNNLVIQGPPGTGKSQTITNVIAELIGGGKTVLFVAEKMAALEVVKRRLDDCHLGDAVLELHSHKATKRSVLDDLKRTLELGRPLNEVNEDEFEQLKQLQDDLTRYCEVVNTPAGASGLPFIDVLGHYLRLKRHHPSLPILPFAPMVNWHYSDLKKHQLLVEDLVRHLNVMGRPDRSVFWGSQLTYFSPIEQSAANDELQAAQRLLKELLGTTTLLSTQLMLTQPASLTDVEMICRAARRAADAPQLDGIQLSTNEWQVRRDAIRDLLEAGATMAACHQQFDEMLIDAAWVQDLLEVRQALQIYGNKWWRLLSGRFRAAHSQLQGLARGILPKSPLEQLAIVDAVLLFQQAQKIYLQHAGLGLALFGAQWQQQKSDWQVLERLSSWVIQLHDDMGAGEIPPAIVAFLSGQMDAAGISDKVNDIENSSAALSTALDRILELTGMQAEQSRSNARETSLSELGNRLRQWEEQIETLHQMTRFNVLAADLRQADLEPLLKVAICSDTPEQMPQILDLSWYTGLVEVAYAREPLLQRFDRLKHENQVARFKRLDLASLDHAKTRLALQIWEKAPRLNQPGEMAILRTELNKKRRHLPIRQLIDKAGRAIQQFKPVFMMSPLSIANFLPPGKLEFDVVVFDEASQVKAIDAFGAIMRGKQVVVVGDTRQMPPTDFFSRNVNLEDDEAAVTADIESILSMFKAAGAQERYLRWHYRSRHESLIAVSNVEFYDNKLVVFPSAGVDQDATGIHFEYMPEAIYDRGRTRTNKLEAKAVAQAVIQHAKRTPHLSLGVAAFSAAQRNLIQVEVELLQRQYTDTEYFFNRQTSEPFFVKNLENIQGDERDAIFVSIGYGRNESGRVAKEFGPLNRDGGHRRLNVLITRAKLEMRIFCNFRADDLSMDANTSLGIRALKNFLKYAETGELEVVRETFKAVDSPFEQEVIDALRGHNYEIEPQVGTAGYFIDIGVKDPENPGRYVLAIECDGASYHSSQSARDRDRLRQGVLEGLGWNFHRIWSTDWFRNPKQEAQRAVEAIEAARKKIAKQERSTPQVVALPPHEIVRDSQAMSEEVLIRPPYVKVSLPPDTSALELHQVAPHQLMHLIKTVVDGESPVHLSDVTRRLMDSFSISRSGKRINVAISEAIPLGIRDKMFSEKNGFLYAPEDRAITVRDRSDLGNSEKKIELIAPEELEQAICETVRAGFSMSMGEAISGALALLGFSRATAKMASLMEERIQALIINNVLCERNGIIMFQAREC